MVSITRYVKFIRKGDKGDKGAVMRGPQAWNDCAVGYKFQAGGNGDEFKDIVLYNGNYYSCVTSHTKTSSNYPDSATDTNNSLWRLGDKFEVIATKILLTQYALVENLGVEHIEIKGNNGISLIANKDGITCVKGTFKDVNIVGSLRNPFTLVGDSFNTNYNDNVAVLSDGGVWASAYSMPWDVSQSGRRLTIVNYKWGSTMAWGQADISAPSGKYFYEDGIQKNKLKVSREIIELIGYGTSSQFYGWIVLNRIDLMATQKYGHCLKALAFGTVTGTKTSASISYKTFDGSTMGASRVSEGVYKVTFPSSWFNNTNYCRVIPTGRGNTVGNSTPCKANLASVGSGNFTVDTSDDNSRNDGSFDFIIYNGSDFDIL